MRFIRLSLAFLAFTTSAGLILNFYHKLSLDFNYFTYLAESAFNANRDVYFSLYTKSNPSSEQNISVNSASLASSNFNPMHPTRVVIHDYQNSHASPVPVGIKDAYLKKGNFNVVSSIINFLKNDALGIFQQILVDWAALTMDENYLMVQIGCESVASALANFLQFLVAENVMSLGKLVMSGHGLGKSAE